MSRPRNAIQYSFEGGEADPQFERRADADLWLVTARRMRNVRLTNGGGFRRRPGLRRLAALDGAARLKEFVARAGEMRMLAFRDDELDVFESDGALETNQAGMAWAGADLATMQFSAENDRVIVTHRSFFPQELFWDGAAFAVANLAFDTRQDGSLGQPYWRFQETKGITMDVSALSGAGVTVTMDDDVFVAGHVGVRFRRFGRELQITGVTNPTTATATVITPLYPTRQLTVGSSAAFAVGDQVQSSVDDINMEVAVIVDATHIDVNLVDGFTDPSTASNNLLGPNGSTTITAVGAASIAPTVQWDEALISGVRGFPGGCVFHKGRLTLLDFPGAPEIVAWSVLREPGDFDTGDGLDDEAIIDGPGDITGRRARFGVSSEQFLLLTEAGCYYVGEGPNAPITPTTVEFLLIGPEPAGDCNPVLASEGTVFVEAQGERLMLLAPSGQLRRVWQTTEMLALASELMDAPTRLTLYDGGTLGPERYLLAINADGSLLAVHYRRDTALMGPSLWTTEGGAFVDVCRFGGELWAAVNRGGVHTLEAFDNDRLLDNSVIIDNPAATTPTHASWAGRTVALVWRQTAAGEARRADIGEFAGNGAGVLTGAPTAACQYEGGARFFPHVELWPPMDPQAGPVEHQRVAFVAIDILRSGQLYVAGRKFSPYRMSDDISVPPPLRTGWRKKRLLGRKRDYVTPITQIEAAPLEVRAVTLGMR